MNVSLFLRIYAVAFVSFVVIDLIWLGVVARSFYRAELGHLMRPDVNWVAAVLFYLVFVAGIVVFAVCPAIERESLGHAVALGAFFGLVTYAAYDLTNLATLEGFPVRMVVVDMLCLPPLLWRRAGTSRQDPDVLSPADGAARQPGIRTGHGDLVFGAARLARVLGRSAVLQVDLFPGAVQRLVRVRNRMG